MHLQRVIEWEELIKIHPLEWFTPGELPWNRTLIPELVNSMGFRGIKILTFITSQLTLAPITLLRSQKALFLLFYYYLDPYKSNSLR